MSNISDHIILFDGICNLCSNVVQFIIKRDKGNVFKFASLQSEVGQKLIHQFAIPINTNSFILIDRGKIYTQSTGALKVASKLSMPWRFFGIFIIVPPFIRNAVYQFIATHRYNWFGKKNECWIPSSALKNKFL